jgi:glycosyltransferase involved in cell wall biosynthesis
MRVLHTIDSLGIYGAETVLLNLAAEQQRRGERPVVLSIGNSRATEKAIEVEARRRRIECVPLRMRDGLNLAGGMQIARIAQTCGVDVIHSHGYKSNILLALLPRRARKIPVVTTLHGWTAKSPWSKLGVYRMLDQRLLSRLDAVVVVNEHMLRLPALARLERTAQAIANGVTIHEAAPADGHEGLAKEIAALRSRHPTLLGVVGRLSPEKNVSALIEALHQLANSHPGVGLVVLGAGSDLERLERSITQLGLTGRVLLGGYVANARDYLPQFDLLVIPSLTEGLPMILLEAMAARVPVISTRVGDIPAVLGGLGALVEPGDVQGLANAIDGALHSLPERRALAAQAAERVASRYSASAMADRYSQVYQSVVKECLRSG